MHIVQALVSMNVGGSELVATELAEFLTARNNKVTIIAADGPIGDRARACGAHHVDWPIGKKRLGTLRYIWRLKGWLETERPDIVHVHSRWPAWICWQAISRMDEADRPAFVTTMHGHYSVSGYSAVMAKGRKVIAVSEHIRQYTLKNYPGIEPEKVVTIHGGASRDDFPYGYRPEPGWRDGVESEFPGLAGKRWLLMPGRVTRWKGHREFLELVGRIHMDYPDVQGVIVGGCREGSSYLRELHKTVANLNIGSQVTFTGNRFDIRDWMSGSSLIYNLSNNPPEAFGRTVLESLCLGRPMIGWQQGGAAEIIAAMFPQGAVETEDMDELERRTRLFLDHPPQVVESTAFSLEESMNKHLAVYEELLGPHDSPGHV